MTSISGADERGEWYEILEAGGPECIGLTSFGKNFDFYSETDQKLLEVLEQRSVMV